MECVLFQHTQCCELGIKIPSAKEFPSAEISRQIERLMKTEERRNINSITNTMRVELIAALSRLGRNHHNVVTNNTSHKQPVADRFSTEV